MPDLKCGSDPGEVPERFRRACLEAGVAPGDIARLFALHGRWRRPGLDEEARLKDLLLDHGHYRLYLASRDGDAQAAAAFESYWRTYCRKHFGRRFKPEQLEDVAGQFFERVYRLVGRSYAWGCPFGLYLRAMVINVSRDEGLRLGKRRSREVSLDDDTPRYEAKAERRPSPEEEAISSQRLEALERALLQLEPADRHVVRACLVDETDARVLAAELGTTRQAIYQRLFRAKRRLRALLAGAGVGGKAGR